MFTAPIWDKKQTLNTHSEFCFLMLKRMTQSVIIAGCALIFFLIGHFLFAEICHCSVLHIVVPVTTLCFCPLFTLYNVKKDCEARDNLSVQSPDFFDRVLVYIAEYFALLVMLLYVINFKDIVVLFLNKKCAISDWLYIGQVSLSTIGYWSIFVYLVANKPDLKQTFRHLRILPFFKKIFPYVFVPFMPVGLGINLLSGNGCNTIFFAWFCVMIAIFFRTIWNRRILAFVTIHLIKNFAYKFKRL
jgi:hypothetical protein